MAVTPSTFRTAFPAFRNSGKFPDPTVNFWIAQAAKFVGEDRWGDSTDLGIMLYAAHNIALSAKEVAQGEKGGTPGASVGVVNSKSVDKVSVGYDVNVATEQGAGFWNSTTYGVRFWRLAQIFGAGPVQCNTPGDDPTGGLNGNAWPGPLWPVF